MINRGSERIGLAVTPALCALAAEPPQRTNYPRCRERTLRSEEGCFLSDGSSEVSLGCVLTLWFVPISPGWGAVGGL